LDPDHIITPGIYVKKIFQGEQRWRGDPRGADATRREGIGRQSYDEGWVQAWRRPGESTHRRCNHYSAGQAAATAYERPPEWVRPHQSLPRHPAKKVTSHVRHLIDPEGSRRARPLPPPTQLSPPPLEQSFQVRNRRRIRRLLRWLTTR
jgi:hypothetical protein